MLGYCISLNKATITTYIGGFVYQNDTLQFVSHEEGRIRPQLIVPATGYTPANINWVYDYFEKDHLGNVRMVLTEKQDTSFYPAATMETAQATTEEALYANLPETRTAISTVAGYPTDNTTSPNNEVAEVSGSGQKIGPSIVLKVMAGDKFNIKVSSWYQTNGADPETPNSSLTDLITNLITGLSSVAIGAHGNVTTAGLQNSGVITPDVNSFLNAQPDDPTKPKAYLNWILLDEQFRYVASGSGAEQVPDESAFGTPPNQQVYPLVETNLPVTENGYLYVYVSNETPNINVFFDNLQVTHIHGQILEETHYYPFGLTMQGISSKSALGLENKYKYNGIELDTSLGLDEYEAQLRDLDPQLGRWWQVDPETEDQEMWSPYTSNNDNPILYEDPRGNEGEACCQWLKDIATTVVATTSVAVDNTFGTNLTGKIANSGYIPSSETDTWNNAVTTSNRTFVVAGTDAAVIGGGAASDAAVTTAASGGLLSEGTVPIMAVGTVTAAVGTVVAANASRNLAQGNGLIKSNSNGSSGRGSNNRKPDPGATGDHTVSNDRGSTTYKKNDKNPSGFQESKRVDTKGKSHGGVPTPHVHEAGKVRPAQPDEIPKTNLQQNQYKYN